MSGFRVYYDGGCRVCSAEIGFYMKLKGAEAIDWVDIDAVGFDAASEGVDPVEVNRVFHAKDEQGNRVTGVDAFIEIWKRIPSLRPFAWASRIPGARGLLKAGYAGFVRIRPYLPRKAARCADDRCYPARRPNSKSV